MKKYRLRFALALVVFTAFLSSMWPAAGEAQDKSNAPVNQRSEALPSFPVLAYSITDLGTLGGTQSFARDVNDRGQVTGNASNSAARLHAYIWENNGMIDLGILPGVDFSRGFAINEAGVVTGESDNNSSKAFVYDPAVGSMVSLASLVTSNPDNLNISGGFGADINNANQIVGTMSNANTIRAFLFDNGVVRDLGTLDGNQASPARAWGLNNFRKVVGLARNSSGVSHAFLWSNGTMTDLGALGGDTAFSEALAINDRGQVVGRSVVTAGMSPQNAFLWENGTMVDLGTLPTLNFARGNDINSFGVIVGTASQFEGFSGRAFIRQPGGMLVDLNTLLPANSGWTLTSAEGINNYGQIAGFGTIGGQTRAFLMTPYDVCLYDNTTGDSLLINSTSGDYQLIRCSTGTTSYGRGVVSLHGCQLSLRAEQFAGRKVEANFNVCQLTGEARVSFYPRNRFFRINDAEPGNNCGGACP